MASRARCRTCLIVPVFFAMSFGSGCSDDGESSGATIGSASISGGTPAGGTPGGGTDGGGTDGGTTDSDSGTDSDSDTGSPTTGAGADDPAWMTPYCYTVADMKWQAVWIEREQRILQLVNEARAKGHDCGGEGEFAPTGPLVMSPNLHCAARKHSQDMAERNFFDHDNPDGESPFDRMERAGYAYLAAGENIAAGSDDPVATVEGWLESDGHCANMMDPKYTDFGIGFYEGPGEWVYYWTQTFGTPK